MAGRSSSKTLMNLPLRKQALPVMLHFSYFFFFLWTCETPSWSSILLFRHDFRGNQQLRETLRSSISLGSVSCQSANIKQSFIMRSDSVGQNSKDSLVLLHNLEGLRPEAGCRDSLKAHSLTCLIFDAGCRLGKLSSSPWSLQVG